MGFDVGVVPFNPDGWGPPDTPAAPLLPPRLSGGSHPANIPFAPFSRSEKLGRIADWTRNASANASHPSNSRDAVFDFALDDASALAADDDSSFRLVDARPPPRPKFGPRWRFNQRPQLPQRRDEEVEARRREAEKERARRDRMYHLHRSNNAGGQAGSSRGSGPAFRSSVDIQPEWTMLDQIPFSTFTKLSFSVPDPPEDLLVCGSLEFYDRLYDRVNPKNEKRLERFKARSAVRVTTTDDPVIRRLAAADKATVFATDAILSALMCAPRSVHSWDIVIQRVGNKLFLDKRDRSQIDMLPVNETAQEPLPDSKDDINSLQSLSEEASEINQKFAQQVLVRDGNKVTFDEPNPFVNSTEGSAAGVDEQGSIAYRYRRWRLDGDTYLVARCEVHAVSDVKGQRSFMTLNALNEFDPKYTGVDWRQKLETQRGAVLATELKNNANKLARWTAQALLSGADIMKLGYVSRVHPRDRHNHVILSVIGYKPRDFAAQINLNTANMWGIVKSIVDLCMKLGEGKYVLVKDPAKPQVRIYEVAPDAFENDYVEEPLPEEEQVQVRLADKDGESGLVADAEATDGVANGVAGGDEAGNNAVTI
ncbi:hypothetical protein LUZ63_019734 [Rhynchospora breviuscula]|uniref:Eukaryotic translation initiation factor 3 subunit D n=1 Tax=Rhynchospora breviuscula TaxID=2022672 RepID=A0A9Q0C6U6_9POAL|nr:hypothetical protein LUZ63_019734 [Rhynchospora breviuscula]